MRFHRSATGVVVQAPAKLNLFFEVLGKRTDGYHEIESLVAPIDLFDTLFFAERDDDAVQISCRSVGGVWASAGSWLGDVPTGPENLAVRAVELLRRRAGIRRGATLQLVKRIPSAAGLGGGSSDAAAALWAANLGWRLHWPRAALADLGAELGSDVPLFFAGGPAVVRGRGERVEPVPDLPALEFVLVRPPAGLSTAAVYGACRPGTQSRSVEPLVAALRKGDLSEAARWMGNRLEPAAETLSPWIARLRGEMARAGCPAYQMSGSGTCYFGICRHRRHARCVAGRLQARGVGVAMVVRGCG
jgi:4-diphosphocytidyl-2-C-methyl-D-erythritol kinase